jgi:hypothetical protein
VLASVLTAWLVFVRALVVDWLADRTVARNELRAISVGALMGALGRDNPLLSTMDGHDV